MKRKIIHGEKGREYSEIANEIEQYYYDWLLFAGISEQTFFEKLNGEPHRIAKTEAANGEVQLSIFAGAERVAVPLVFQPGMGNSKKEFFANAALVLFCAARRSGNKSFEKCVSEFFKSNKSLL